ncbi:putative protease SohB [invertebrate metagenome]|uniref:Putative protease SohB n=1 Tax=invertebrate metagenome TaxID=1711999 RepID=A0A2H9T3R6_9ZZZZ
MHECSMHGFQEVILEYFADFLLFFSKTITLLGGIAVLIALIASASHKSRKALKGHLEITQLNEHYQNLKEALQHTLMDKHQLKSHIKEGKKQKKEEQKKEKQKSEKSREKQSNKPRVFILDFYGDLKASAVKSLREEITAVLSVANPKQDEVVLRLESGGGMVHSYGLASSQLQRIRSRHIKLTIAVDKVAASGGYMMACTGNRIIAAPFAILGSIGVMAQLPNINRLLKKHEVDIELHTAGEYKRTLTMLGANTEKGRKKFKQDMEDTHQLFKDFVKNERKIVDIDKIATGEVWYGQKALEVNLVDDIMTSDEYIYQKVDTVDLIQVRYTLKKGITDKLGLATASAVDSTLMKCWERLTTSRFFS